MPWLQQLIKFTNTNAGLALIPYRGGCCCDRRPTERVANISMVHIQNSNKIEDS